MKTNIYLRLLSYFKPFMYIVAVSAVLAIVINLSELAGPYIIKIIIDDHIIAGDAQTPLLTYSLLYLAAVLLGAVSNYAQVYLFNLTGQKIMYNIRVELFSHIQKLPLSFFDRNSSGRILTRITNDVETLSELFSGVLVSLFKDLFMLIGIIIVMVNLNLRLALVSFCVVPLILAVVWLYKSKAILNYKKVRRLIAAINGFFAENISGMKIVQLFNRQKEKYDEFNRLNEEYRKASKFEVRLMSFFKPSAELINYLGIAVIIWYALPGISNQAIELGVLFAFITYIKRFFEPINDLADKYNVILSGGVSAGRIFELMDNNEGLEDLNSGDTLEEIKGKIEFRNVWFAYNEGDWVLKDVSFTIAPGETAAFVGSTGSGKSTIISLIGRFYDIQEGEILLDDKNIKEISLGELRRHIAVVMQDVFLFSGNIASNIRLNNEIAHNEIVEAAEYVNADDFINHLPGKYEEEVKERGCTLSSGQRQLLSFARAIAFKPSIIVLDEATSSIDTDTEIVIQDSLSKLSGGRTVLVIAHRLSTIKSADKIIVIEDGIIREFGTHDELMASQGIYTTLVASQ
jgi:ATP-binding cassette, subfamily B, multidrug efflux pump